MRLIWQARPTTVQSGTQPSAPRRPRLVCTFVGGACGRSMYWNSRDTGWGLDQLCLLYTRMDLSCFQKLTSIPPTPNQTCSDAYGRESRHPVGPTATTTANSTLPTRPSTMSTDKLAICARRSPRQHAQHQRKHSVIFRIPARVLTSEPYNYQVLHAQLFTAKPGCAPNFMHIPPFALLTVAHHQENVSK